MVSKAQWERLISGRSVANHQTHNNVPQEPVGPPIIPMLQVFLEPGTQQRMQQLLATRRVYLDSRDWNMAMESFIQRFLPPDRIFSGPDLEMLMETFLIELLKKNLPS